MEEEVRRRFVDVVREDEQVFGVREEDAEEDEHTQHIRR